METFGIAFCGILFVLGAIGAVLQKAKGNW